MLVSNSAQVREIDRIMIEEYEFPSLLLMENAGRAASRRILDLYPDTGRFLVVCGPGSNGGDGLVIARHLWRDGRKVHILFTKDPRQLDGDAYINFRIIDRAGISWEVFKPGSMEQTEQLLSENGLVVIDAIFGTGLRAKVKEPASQLIAWLGEKKKPAVAVDMPSGLLGDTGAVLTEPIRAEHTLALGLPKICHYVTPAATFCGKVHILDIGVYPHITDRPGIRTQLLSDRLMAQWRQPRDEASHKGTYGHVLLAGGSKGKSGAIALSASAVLEAGAGLVTAFVPGSIAPNYHQQLLEGMSIPYGSASTAHLNSTAADVFATYLADKSAVVLGPGMDDTTETAEFVQKALPAIQLPLVLDADALNVIAKNPAHWQILQGTKEHTQTVITPHPGEMARLVGLSTDEVQAKRYEIALQVAMQKKVIVVLKGAGTVVASPGGSVYLCPAGNPGMATAGTGDVLTGVIAGFMAQGYNAFKAAAMGVYLHAAAGDMAMRLHGQEAVTATKIQQYLGPAWQQILENGAAELAAAR